MRLDAYGQSLSDDGILIVDSTLVTNVPARFRKVFKIAATSLAEEKIGLPVVANVIMFGALAKITGWGTPEACKKAIADTVPPKALDQNYSAFDLGYSQAGEGK